MVDRPRDLEKPFKSKPQKLVRIKLTEDDRQIFVTSLNKLDNPRARELVRKWLLSNQFLDDNEKAEKWDKKLEFLISQGLNEKEAEQFSIGVDKAFIEEAVRLSEENKQLKEIICKPAFVPEDNSPLNSLLQQIREQQLYLQNLQEKNEQAVTENCNLKQKLDAVQKYLDDYPVPSYGLCWHNDITKFLGAK